MDQPLLFLIKLAWACRYRLPLLITIGFMALDIRMQLEIHVQMRRIRRGPPLPLRGGRDDRSVNDADQNSTPRNNSDDSSDSWVTVEEDSEDHDHEGVDLDERRNEEHLAGTSRPINLVEETDSYIGFPEITNMLMHNNLLDVNVEN